jgi:hypothetical protein
MHVFLFLTFPREMEAQREMIGGAISEAIPSLGRQRENSAYQKQSQRGLAAFEQHVGGARRCRRQH